jgi:DNA-directed RNA polymerase specialized sigma24 family protein
MRGETLATLVIEGVNLFDFDFDVALGRVFAKNYMRSLSWARVQLGCKEDAEDLVMRSVSDIIERERPRFRGNTDAAVLNLLLRAIDCDIKDEIRRRTRARRRGEYPMELFEEYTGEHEEDDDNAYTRKEGVGWAGDGQ